MRALIYGLGLIVLILSCGSVKEEKKVESYENMLKRISEKRHELQKKYKEGDDAAKDFVMDAARAFLFKTITKDVFTQWYNTAWTFEGHCSKPKQGSIACGYFVTAVLSDAGFDLPRSSWAQLASEVFILKMTKDVKRFSNKPIADVKKYIMGRDDGLYIVGLDCHVGYIYKSANTLKFVHSNYYQRDIGVMSENLDTKNPLNDSKYRIVGRILDDAMVKKWLEGKSLNS
jgi:hypothetical protein